MQNYNAQSKRTKGNIKTLMEHNPRWDDNKLYTTHTITIDTPTRKNAVIHKSDIAMATDTRTLTKMSTKKAKYKGPRKKGQTNKED